MGESVLYRVQWNSGASPAYVFLVLLITLGVVGLVYGIFNDYVTSVFYNMAMVNSGGADTSVFDLIVDYWTTYYIIGFVISLIAWSIVNATRPDEF